MPGREAQGQEVSLDMPGSTCRGDIQRQMAGRQLEAGVWVSGQEAKSRSKPGDGKREGRGLFHRKTQLSRLCGPKTTSGKKISLCLSSSFPSSLSLSHTPLYTPAASLCQGCPNAQQLSFHPPVSGGCSSLHQRPRRPATVGIMAPSPPPGPSKGGCPSRVAASQAVWVPS